MREEAEEEAGEEAPALSATVQGYLASRDDLELPYRYEAPYFRTAIEVLRALPSSARSWTQTLRPQSGVLAEGQPICELCTPLMLGAIMGSSFTREATILDEAARSWCPCRADWQRALEVEGHPLATRIEQGIALLESAFPARPASTEAPVGSRARIA